MSYGVRVLALLIAVTTLSFAPAGGGGLKRLTLGTDTITGGYALSGIVETFPCSANQQYSIVDVTSSMPSVASVESPVYVECGFPNTADVGITTYAVTSPRTVTIRATKGSMVREQQLTVTPNPHLVSLTVQQPAYYGLPTYATLQLDFPAPPGGLSFTVSSNDPYVNPPWRGAFNNPVENPCAIASEYAPIAVVPTGQTACSFPVDILTANFTPSSVTLIANAGAATIQSTFNPLTPAPNLFIRKIELTQAIQYLDDPNPIFADNSLPLIKAKPLAVRVFVNSEGTGQEYDGVPVSLWTRRSSHEDWKMQNNRVSQPMRVTPVITNEKERWNWASDVTYNNVTFIIDPWDFILGTLDIRAEVNPIQPLGTNAVPVPTGTRVVSEVNYGDNTRELTGVVFHSTHSLKVKFVKIDWHPNPFGKTRRPSWSVLDRILPYLEMVYPVERVDYSKASKEVNIGVFEAAIGAADFNQHWAWEYVLDKLDVFETFTDTYGSTKYFALLDEGVSHHSIAGLAETSGSQRSAAGHTGEHANQGGILDKASATAAQEIGHLFDRRHAPCGNPSLQDDNWPDSTNPGAIIGHTGFDVVEPQPLKGDLFTDFMSYCWPNWTSPYT